MRPEGEDRKPERAAPHAVRVDKWLWAARFFKSRSLAVEAIASGKVEVNGARVKPAHDVKATDEVRVRLGPYDHVLNVLAVSERRGPAAQATLLYEETAESRAAREKLRWQLKHAAPVIEPGKGRPTKRDRRKLGRLKDW
ncbi:MAG: RNA-binding S4 domain-containing protein [Gemmatimonadales bacterium]